MATDSDADSLEVTEKSPTPVKTSKAGPQLLGSGQKRRYVEFSTSVKRVP